MEIEPAAREAVGQTTAQPSESLQVQEKDEIEFGEAQVSMALKACGKIFKKQTEQQILKSAFVLENKRVTLQLVNQTLLDFYQEMKQDILDFLRKEIGSSQLQIEAILVAAKSEAKPRTEQEKFTAMVEKNPALKLLKDELGLDLIY
ncbi:hypothetical protein [Marinilongibacter aquaticus]|uniref:hypothetical protein n=1 Tax=Marinilongibacter aquaticus TaxID=2975157 RepID=UPI00286E6049|nr:hypothetical protein [Marinilongibacter aquaticus]